ncbi:MAG: aspartate dehydrogenase [Pseudomonadota bacterium]
MKLAVIGKGAIARYVGAMAAARGHEIGAVLVRPEAVGTAQGYVGAVRDLPGDTRIVLDCAGHQALAQFGPEILSRGIDVITVSIGALADRDLADRLERAARDGGATLHLASGAIGALDCLSAASVGGLRAVTYRGRKPPAGWKGSPAEAQLDLDALSAAATHFDGNAGQAALAYPKNANVAAVVALAGLGFEATRVQLIADPTITRNIHELSAEGEFGTFRFEISGNALPDNPRSSALAAMSVLSKLDQITQKVSI